MEPTLQKGMHVAAKRVTAGDLSRGDIVIIRKGEDDWVMRLAALPGDRIALVDGTVVLNGEPVEQRAAGRRTYFDGYEDREAAILVERLPGEGRAHRILDTGQSPADDMPEIELGPDRYFVLGDNRDNAADSRHPNPFGLGIVRGEQIRRRVQLD